MPELNPYSKVTRFKDALKLVNPSRAIPLDLARVADYLRTDLAEDLEGLQLLAARAAEEAERCTGRAMLQSTYRYTLSAWPKDTQGYVTRVIELPRSPLVSVESIQYYDTSDVLQTLEASRYIVASDFEPGCIYLKLSYDWPELAVRPDAVQITFVAGYGEKPVDVSPSLRQAMLLMCRSEFAGGNPNTNASPEDDAKAALRILDSQKVGGWTA